MNNFNYICNTISKKVYKQQTFKIRSKFFSTQRFILKQKYFQRKSITVGRPAQEIYRRTLAKKSQTDKSPVFYHPLLFHFFPVQAPARNPSGCRKDEGLCKWRALPWIHGEGFGLVHRLNIKQDLSFAEHGISLR